MMLTYYVLKCFHVLVFINFSLNMRQLLVKKKLPCKIIVIYMYVCLCHIAACKNISHV